MAVLSNTMMQGTAADTGEADYKIDKSLRFDKIPGTATGFLNRKQRKGDSRTWTYSAWCKRAEWDANYAHELFGVYVDTDNKLYFQIDYQQSIVFRSRVGGTWTNAVMSESRHRDPGGFFHIVLVGDSNNSIEDDRLRLYLNGKRMAMTGNNNYAITQYVEFMYNKLDADCRVGRGQNENNYYSGYLSDVHFLDGIALHAGAFGKFDSTGVWKAKELKRPTPNNGTTWSNTAYWSCGEQGSYPFDNGFNGDTGTIAELDNSGTTGWVTQTFTPPNPIPVSSEVRIHGTGTSVYYSINGGKKYKGTSTGKWQTVFQGGGEITTVDFFADTNAPAFRAIEVDGVILLDGVTDSGEGVINNVNNGDCWSDGNTSYMNSSGSGFPSNPGNSFDGSLGTWGGSFTGHGSQWRFKPDRSIVWKDKIEVFQQGENDTNAEVSAKYNDAGDWIAGNKGKWSIVKEGGGTLTQLNGKNADSTTGGIKLYAIRIDGHILINQGNNNSFHLKFNDSSALKNLGYSQVMNEPTGAQPMYGPGANDGSKANLVLALPGYDLNDHSATIKGSGSNKTVTATGAVIITDGNAKFYGTCLKFVDDGSNDVLSIANNEDLCDFGTGNFTMEAWLKPTKSSDSMFVMGCSKNGSNPNRRGPMIFISAAADNEVRFEYSTGGTHTAYINDGTRGATKDEWTHVAVVRNGNDCKLYVNGIQDGSTLDVSSIATAADNDDDPFTIGNNSDSTWGAYDGYMQDVRVYKGAAKYTANFIPPARNDFTANNFSHTGITIDSLADTPTNTQCTFNSVSTGGTLSDGNLKIMGNGGYDTAVGTVAANSGKWYAEFTIYGEYNYLGIANASHKIINERVGSQPNAFGVVYLDVTSDFAFNVYNDEDDISMGADYNTDIGDSTGIAMVAMDIDAKKIWWGLNGTWFANSSGTGNPATGANPHISSHANFTDGYWTWAASPYASESEYIILNAGGARDFNYTPPAGFKSLQIANLPDIFSGDDKNDPSKFFDVIKYDGNSNTNKVTGFNFSPEMVWIKNRETAYSHRMFDKNRGALKIWAPDDEGYGETSVADTLTSFDSNGFTLSDGDSWGVNANKKYIAWCWDASTVTSISAGDSDYGSPDIASTNYTNATAGIDIVKFNVGASGEKKVAHRLGTVPDFAILKELNDNSNYHYVLANQDPYDAAQPLINETYYRLEATSQKNGGDNVIGTEGGWTNAVFEVGSGSTFNANTDGIAYLFTEIAGYSKFGKYEGNADNDGPFVYCGFKPKWIILKNSDSAGDWQITDAIRDGKEDYPYNPISGKLYSNVNNAESTSANGQIDFLSNGFKIRSSHATANASSTHIFFAFAEHPFKTARAN